MLEIYHSSCSEVHLAFAIVEFKMVPCCKSDTAVVIMLTTYCLGSRAQRGIDTLGLREFHSIEIARLSPNVDCSRRCRAKVESCGLSGTPEELPKGSHC
jgi:hypothetical protein